MAMNANAKKSTFSYKIRDYRAKQWCKKFTRKNKQSKVYFHFGGKARIPVKKSFTYLGVILSFFANWIVLHKLKKVSLRGMFAIQDSFYGRSMAWKQFRLHGTLLKAAFQQSSRDWKFCNKFLVT